MYRITLYLLFFSLGILLSSVCLKALSRSRIARHFGDAPNHRKVHQTIIPRLGGLGIISSFLILFGLQFLIPTPLWPDPGPVLVKVILFICGFMVIAGSLDDTKGVNYQVKFLMQFALATVVVVVWHKHFANLSFFGHRFHLPELGPVLSIFWIMAVMNAFNIIDGIDGLAAGSALVGFAAVAYIARSNGAMDLFATCLGLMGVTAAFLRFNLSRDNKMFLGDTGSQFLGAMLAVLAMEIQALPRSRCNVFMPLLIVGYPLFDISVAMVRRFAKRGRRGFSGRFIRMFSADNEHLHHRLVFLGMTHMQSTFLLLMVAGSMGAVAISITRLGIPGRMAILGYLAAALFLILNRLRYVGIKPWLTVPRMDAQPERIVGVIEPDEVFMHSLKSFKQNKFRFLGIPSKLTQFMSEDLVAVLLYNAQSERFEEEWTKALRATEIQDCPAVVIADAKDIEMLKAMKPTGYRYVHFMEKPVRVPELIRFLEGISAAPAKTKAGKARTFSLAELALRNGNRA